MIQLGIYIWMEAWYQIRLNPTSHRRNAIQMEASRNDQMGRRKAMHVASYARGVPTHIKWAAKEALETMEGDRCPHPHWERALRLKGVSFCHQCYNDDNKRNKLLALKAKRDLLRGKS